MLPELPNVKTGCRPKRVFDHSVTFGMEGCYGSAEFFHHTGNRNKCDEARHRMFLGNETTSLIG